jgi:hypothetical protein
MFDYVYGHDALVADFVSKLIPELHGRSLARSSKAFGVVNKDGALIAGMVYHNWDPEAGVIEMSGAAIDPRWLNVETLRRMYQYPYLGLKCQMTFMRVAATNERLLRQLAAFNYTFIRMPRMLGRDQDAVLCQLTVEAWSANKVCQRYKHHLLEVTHVSEAA